MREETPISAKKIWMNIKNFWWICVLTTVIAAAMVVLATWKDHKADVASAMRDTYQANSMLFFPVEGEMEATTLMTILSSQQIISKLAVELEAQGMEPYDSGRDKMAIQWLGNCFPITVNAEGKERTLLICEIVTSELLIWAESHFEKQGQIVNDPTVFTSMEYSSGAVAIYPLGTPRTVQLSIGSFLSWQKIMILCAGVLCGCALIFVVLIFDSKLRSEKEIQALCDYPCLGNIHKKSEEDLSAAAAVIVYKRNQTTGACLYVSGQDASTMKRILDLEGASNVESCRWNTDRVAVLSEGRQYETAVLFLTINKDTVDDIKKMITDLSNVQTEILGYILTEG